MHEYLSSLQPKDFVDKNCMFLMCYFISQLIQVPKYSTFTWDNLCRMWSYGS